MVGPQQIPDDGSAQFSDDGSAMLELLSHRRRRNALNLLAEGDRSHSLTALATEIADRELAAPSAATRRARIDDVRISLYHTHLPKLADGGLIEFDPDRKTAALTGSSGAVGDVQFST